MKFRCNFNDMQEAVVALGKAVKKDRALESQMQLVRLTAAGETLKVAVNKTIGVEFTLPAKVEEAGEFITSFSSINIITLRNCEGNITGETTDTVLVLKYKNGKAKSSLPLAAGAFAEIPQPGESATKMVIPLEKLSELYGGTAFIADAAPEYLHVIKLSVADDDDGIMKVSMTTCDGKSAGQVTAYCVKKGDFVGDTEVPPERVKLILDILKGKDGEISISFEDNRVYVSADNVRICFPAMDSRNMPDLQKILNIRKSMAFSVQVSRQEFIEAMKCVTYLQPDGAAMLAFSGNEVAVGCPGITEYAEKLDAAEVSGEFSAPVLFNAALLKNIAEKIPGEALTIKGLNEKSPFFFPYGENEEYLFCALPRVQR